MTNTTADRPVFEALTGVRFPLALWVVSYHLSGPGHLWADLTAYAPVATILGQAFASLGMFFALSGFLLTLGYSRRRWTAPSTLRYFAARLTRIYPLYLVSVAVIAPIAAEQWNSPSLQGKQLWAAVSYLFLLQGWAKPPVDWNTPAWSLSCELFFYSCLPVLLVAVRKSRIRPIPTLAALAFVIPVVVQAARCPDTLKPFIYAGDFVAGMATAAVYEWIVARRPALLGRGARLYVPAMVSIAALVLFGDRIHPWLLYDESMRLASAALVLGLALGGGFGAAVLSSRWMVAGGTAAYAIYILHVPVLWWFRRFSLPNEIPPVAAGFMYVAVVLVVAAAASRLIEFPAKHALRKRASDAVARAFRRRVIAYPPTAPEAMERQA